MKPQVPAASLVIVVAGILLMAVVVVLSNYRLAAQWPSGGVELAPAVAPRSKHASPK